MKFLMLLQLTFSMHPYIFKNKKIAKNFSDILQAGGRKRWLFA